MTAPLHVDQGIVWQIRQMQVLLSPGCDVHYLDGVYQDIYWVLDNQGNPVVRAKIDGSLDVYRSSGVKWIRI